MWIRCKAGGFLLEAGTDELISGEAAEGFEPLGKVVGIEEGAQMLLELSMAIVVISSHSGFLDGAIHAFDLTIGPRVIWLGQAMIDVMAGAGGFKGMGSEDLALLPG